MDIRVILLLIIFPDLSSDVLLWLCPLRWHRCNLAGGGCRGHKCPSDIFAT